MKYELRSHFTTDATQIPADVLQERRLRPWMLQSRANFERVMLLVGECPGIAIFHGLREALVDECHEIARDVILITPKQRTDLWCRLCAQEKPLVAFLSTVRSADSGAMWEGGKLQNVLSMMAE